MDERRSEITVLLESIRRGDEGAWSRLLPLVYSELHGIARSRLARLRPGQTIQATDLVHEAYLRLAREVEGSWEHRGHFFAVASLAMRDILVTAARRRNRLRRGGDWTRVTLHEGLVSRDDHDEKLIALDEALVRLEKVDPLQHRIVLLRYFGGLEGDNVARILEVSPSTVDRQWRFARAWLHREIERGSNGSA